MKLYNGMAPNPRRVRIYLAEKNIEIERVDLSFQDGEHRQPEILALNSLGKLPILELDDGRAIAESLTICRYLEELHPDPPLFGSEAFERATIDMWQRRMEHEILQVVANIGVHTLEFFKPFVTQIPAYAEAQRSLLSDKLAWLDKEISDGRSYLAGDDFSVADITAMAASRPVFTIPVLNFIFVLTYLI